MIESKKLLLVPCSNFEAKPYLEKKGLSEILSPPSRKLVVIETIQISRSGNKIFQRNKNIKTQLLRINLNDIFRFDIAAFREKSTGKKCCECSND